MALKQDGFIQIATTPRCVFTLVDPQSLEKRKSDIFFSLKMGLYQKRGAKNEQRKRDL
jgi:hypothetical protein